MRLGLISGKPARDGARSWVRLAARSGPEILVVMAFIAGCLLFLLYSIANVLEGVTHVDDAYVALGAKSLAQGLGYGLPHSSDEFVPFDIDLTTGPPMIIPLAAVIQLFGLDGRLPGAVMLGVFAVQMGAVTMLIAHRVGLMRTVAFGAAMSLLLLAGNRSDLVWVYGTFIGEPVALGFVLLAATLLAVTRSPKAAAVAGACAGLAVLTKLIAIFPVVGLTLAWLVLESRNSRGPGRWRSIAGYVAGGCALIAVFEASKFLALGIDGYAAHWTQTAFYSGALGEAPESPLALGTAVLRAVDRSFIALPTVVVVGVGFVALARRFPADSIDGSVRRLMLLLAGAAMVHWAYLIARYNIHDRYLFLGVSLLLVVAALAVIVMERRARAVAVALLIATTLILDHGAFYRREALGAAHVHAELMAVVTILDADPDAPYAAQHWSSINPMVYLRPNAGTWSYGRDSTRFVGQRMFVVMDEQYTQAQDELVSSVRAHCALTTPTARRYLAYECGTYFWDAFLAPSAVSPRQPAFAVGREPTPGGDCNIDHLVRLSAGVHPRAAAGTTVPLFGWAADVAGGLPPVGRAMTLTDHSGRRTYAVLQADARPDLAAHFGEPDLTESGFKGGLDLTGVTPGEYRLHVLFATGASLLLCDTRRTLTVEPAASSVLVVAP